ncbi:hypothetical protein E2493_11950 [Sphingomonas parva]|uniref:Lipoprotein n=1 Tax=Sphingomonas parva TaxID=2555898 RepID=A0A4Y8ZPL1_9SPHN|nr:hypothetical protein [Sphingomonas parva]TFI57904.1 hypothetical protein E2493_11950 [Sphingomonas parva]
MSRSLLLVSLCAAAAGCFLPVRETVYSRCEALAATGWTARLEPRAGGGGAVAVAGSITLPSAGYEVTLERGPVERIEPRALQVLVRTRAPDAPAAQAVTQYGVSGVFPYDGEIGAVALRCGDGILAVTQIAPKG